MNRYISSKVISLRTDNTSKHATSFVPKIERDNTDLFIRTTAGDRLDNLAHEFYQDVTLWWILASVNNLGKGTFAVPPGTRLRIPLNISNIREDYVDFNQRRR